MKGFLFKNPGKIRLAVIVLAVFSLFLTTSAMSAQKLTTIKLPAANKDRGASVMKALANKASSDSLSEKDLSLQDLSDLLWAAAGINRPDIGKRTFSTAMNTQDTGVYVLMKDGIYVYDYEKHALNPITEGDHRTEISESLKMGGGGAPAGAPGGASPDRSGQPGGPSGEAAQSGREGGPSEGRAGGAPAGAGGRKRLSTFAVDLVIVSEPSKYGAGSDDLKAEWGAFSAGMVAQNVMLFCNANGMGTRPRAAFDKDTVRTLLKLKDTQNPVIEMPVGYPE